MGMLPAMKEQILQELSCGNHLLVEQLQQTGFPIELHQEHTISEQKKHIQSERTSYIVGHCPSCWPDHSLIPLLQEGR
jgi:hypothetical protein